MKFGNSREDPIRLLIGSVPISNFPSELSKLIHYPLHANNYVISYNFESNDS